jgi:imidazoleglycerol-phosphate dehydratase
MSKRTAKISRKTAETSIDLNINLDGSGKSTINTGLGFFDHMLTLFSKHGLFDLTVKVKGDLHVDGHHTVEDVGICLGQAFSQALGDFKGIKRYASALIPMDETLCQIAVDISNRPYLVFKADFPKSKIGDFDAELVEEFFRAFTFNAKLNLHITLVHGDNLHHGAEACFKALAVALDQASSIDPRKKDSIPSTKGVL